MKRILLTLVLLLAPGLAFGQTWTWPGDIRDHMRKHGVDPSGKSFQELRAGHDYIHNHTQQGTPNPDDYKILAQCPTGDCPPGWSGFGVGGGINIGPSGIGAGVRVGPTTTPQRKPRPCQFWPGGMSRLRIQSGRITGYGSAVCVGFGRERGEWVFLTSAHNLESGGYPELFIRGDWVPADILYKDNLAPIINNQRTSDGPDRAILVAKYDGPLRFRSVSYDPGATRVALCGYPGGSSSPNTPSTICGQLVGVGDWVRVSLERPSQGGFSGGGLFNSNSELVGVWSGGIYAEPILNFIGAFRKLGWRPGNWPQLNEDQDEPPSMTIPEPNPDEPSTNEPTPVPDAALEAIKVELHELHHRLNQIEISVKSVSEGSIGERGEQGERGEPGRAPTKEEINDAVKSYLDQHPPTLTEEDIKRAIESWLKENPPKLNLDDDDLAKRVWKRLPPIYPRWVEEDGKILSEVEGGTYLGQSLPLKVNLIKEIVDEAVARAIAESNREAPKSKASNPSN